MRVRVGQTVTWSKPLVSALMVTRDRPAFARMNVDFFLAQTWPWSELIIIDDSKRFSPLDQHPSVKHIFLREVMAMGPKHDLAISHAQGDMLCYWDDDDWFSPLRLDKQARIIVNEQADMTGFQKDLILRLPRGDFWEFAKHDMKLDRWIGNGIGIKGIPIHDGTAMWSRHIAGNKRHANLPVTQKLEYVKRLITDGARVKPIVNDGDFVYIRHGANTWKFREDLKLIPAEAPIWFPVEILNRYRMGVQVG